MSEMSLDSSDIFNIYIYFCIALISIKSSINREQICFSLAFLKVAVIEYNVYVA